MRWVSYRSARDGAEHVGVVEGRRVHGLDTTLLALLHLDGRSRDELLRAEPFEVFALAEARLLAPIPTPPSVRDFMAFENHVVTSMGALGATVDPVWYAQPVFYFTNPAAIIGPDDDHPIAPGCSQWDFELEIAAVVGTAGRDLSPDEAESHIAGYTIFCDWSARDLQAAEMRANLGPAKGKDTASSLGPVLVSPDELAPYRKGNGYDLAMTVSVNGRPYSAGNWADLYWSFPQLLAYASRGTELRPGDVVGSGTVGTGCILELSRVHGLDAYPWLHPGDRVTLEVDQLGAITSTVLPSVPVVPL